MPTSRSRKRGRRIARMPAVRTGQATWPPTREEFARRFDERFYDPAFDGLRREIARIRDIAADGHFEYRKSPRRRRAGAAFVRPGYQLPVEWLDTRAKIRA